MVGYGNTLSCMLCTCTMATSTRPRSLRWFTQCAACACCYSTSAVLLSWLCCGIVQLAVSPVLMLLPQAVKAQFGARRFLHCSCSTRSTALVHVAVLIAVSKSCGRCAGSCHGSSLVVMSKGTRYTQQSYKVSDAFPFEWIKKKWKENFYITGMATAGLQACLECCMRQ